MKHSKLQRILDRKYNKNSGKISVAYGSKGRRLARSGKLLDLFASIWGEKCVIERLGRPNGEGITVIGLTSVGVYNAYYYFYEFATLKNLVSQTSCK